MVWKQIKLGDLFEQYRVQHMVQDNRDYGQITISKNGYIKFRATKNGKNIGRKRQFILDLQQYPNTLLFTRQGVSEGAIAFAPKDVDGCIATENMPMFSLKEGVDRKFVELLLKSEQYINKVKKLIPTGSAQKSIHERDLMQILLTIPSEEEQIELSTSIDNHLNNIEVLNTEISDQQTLLKKLRQSILQDAIEGKLTTSWREQNSDIESASILLEEIKAEKEQLIKDKKIKKQKPLPPIDKEEIPFDIPDSWEYCRLQDISNKIHYGVNASAKPEKYDVRLLRITDIQNNSVNWETVPGCDYLEKDLKSYSLNNNDILIARTGGTIGKSYIVKDITLISLFASYLIRVIPNSNLNADFLKLFIESPLYWKQLYEAAWGAGQPNVNGTSLSKLTLALPPLKEQKEIVKKIENLFIIFDELETQINSSKTNSQILMQAVLKEAFEK